MMQVAATGSVWRWRQTLPEIKLNIKLNHRYFKFKFSLSLSPSLSLSLPLSPSLCLSLATYSTSPPLQLQHRHRTDRYWTQCPIYRCLTRITAPQHHNHWSQSQMHRQMPGRTVDVFTEQVIGFTEQNRAEHSARRELVANEVKN